MKIVAINDLKNGSPARIMDWILDTAHSQIGAETYSFYGWWKDKEVSYYTYGKPKEVLLSGICSRITGLHGIWNIWGTRELIKKLEQIEPDIIHLHNIHMWNTNVPMLFKYIKKNNVRVVWTLHDCWAFTGQCPYFSAVKCEKWKQGCGKCAQLGRYPKSVLDNTKTVFKLKKKWFKNVKQMVLVTPSNWLLDLTKESFLNEYSALCINNGIDLEIFKPRVSRFREKYHIQDKRIVLGVAFEWGFRKGLDVFVELSKVLDSGYVIVLVGYNGKIDCDNIITINRTHDQVELAEIYSTVDVFFNPTREDNFPTVNIEALACGTPVVTFNSGGSSEMIDNTCGVALETENIEEIKSSIIGTIEAKELTPVACRNRALKYSNKDKFREYVDIYEKLMEGRKDE